MRLFSALIGLVMVLSFYPLEAATYYISSDGDDHNSGTSPAEAWASLAKINETIFSPGDKILFEGGSTFEGGMFFGPESSGTFETPILIGSYGTGRATIMSGDSFGLKVYNAAGYRLSNLIFSGSGRGSNRTSGIEFFMDLPATQLDYIEIDSVEVSGYRDSGISIGSWNGRSGFSDVSITNCSVHDNGDAGIQTYAQADDLKETILAHKNVYVAYCKAYNNAGIPEKTHSHSGNGIVLGGVDGALIEYCEAYNNGWLNAWKSGGPVGIWGWQCNNLVIQYNESHHNRTGTGKDGGGFDIDGGSTNSVMQYNYSHDNEGPGYLLAQYHHAPPMKGITVRYNISENDSRKNSYGAIHIWSSGSNGGIQDLDIYHNSIYLTPSSHGTPSAIFVQSGGIRNARIINNILQTSGGLEMVRTAHSADVRFEGNNYWPTGAALKFRWLSSTYTSLEEWQSATGQEIRNKLAMGHVIDPQFKEAGKGVNFEDQKLLYLLHGYELGAGSELSGKGINLQTEYGIQPGKLDFWGNSIEGRTDLSVGAHQPTDNSRACLYGGEIQLSFGQEESGTYSGEGVTEGKFFKPEVAGPGNHAIRYQFTDGQGKVRSISHTIRVVDAKTTTWTGQGDTNSWSDNNNWSSCVPTPQIDVSIPATAEAEPRIQSGELAQLKDLILDAPLRIENGATLEINGHVSGENIAIAAESRSTIVFRSNDVQTIPAAAYGILKLEGRGTKSIRGEISILQELVMGPSNLRLGDHSLSLHKEAVITNASAKSYVVTNGLGRLVREEVEGEQAVEFPVGTLAGYTPVSIRNAGASDSFGVRVEEESRAVVAAAENLQLQHNMVNKIWHIDEMTAGGSDIELQLQWNEWDEPAAFQRNGSFISYFNDEGWSRSGETQLSGSQAAQYQADSRPASPEAGSEEGSYRLKLEHVHELRAFGIGSGETRLTAVKGEAAIRDSKDVVCYPNPFAEQFVLEVMATAQDELAISLTGLTGRTILQKTLPLQPGLNRFTISFNETYPAGLYLLSGRMGDKQFQTKVKKY